MPWLPDENQFEPDWGDEGNDYDDAFEAEHHFITTYFSERFGKKYFNGKMGDWYSQAIRDVENANMWPTITHTEEEGEVPF